MKTLLKHHNEFILLTVIASESSPVDCPVSNMTKGETSISDYKSYGMTEQNYRTAKKNLEKWGFITSRVTGKLTMATLLDSTIYVTENITPNGMPNGKKTPKKKAEKVKYLETVLLSDKEFENLINGWGGEGRKYGSKENVLKGAEILDQYLRSHGKKYQSHYAVMQGWVYDRFCQDNPREASKPKKEYGIKESDWK